jgi:hypothetical protein
VLAVVDDLSCAGMLIRRGAPAQIRTAFKKRDAKTASG